MRILAIDLAKNKSVYLDYVTGGGDRQFGKVASHADELEKLLRRCSPNRLVIEAGPAAGWVCDLAQSMAIPIQVANTNDERWKWKTVKEKSDRKDALKLAQLSEMDSLPTVHVPKPAVRQWRSLIEYRHALVERRTAMKNSIRAIFEREGLNLPSARKAWTNEALEELKKQVADASAEQLWLFQVGCELKQLEQVQEQIEQVEGKLKEIAAGQEAVKRLQTAPCVGPRLSEAVVAILDEANRFNNSRQVGCYAGLTPRRWQSGQSDRQGHISKAGNRLLRTLLVEIAWLGVRNRTWMLEVYERVRRGSEKRKKIAIVAVARRLLVRLWAMLRDGTEWREENLPAKERLDLSLGASSGCCEKGSGPIPAGNRPDNRRTVHVGAPVASQQSRILRVDVRKVTKRRRAGKVPARVG
jgi:transposase